MRLYDVAGDRQTQTNPAPGPVGGLCRLVKLFKNQFFFLVLDTRSPVAHRKA